MIKKISAFALAFCIAVGHLSVLAVASENTNLTFDEYIIRHLENFEAEIDITDYVRHNNWDMKTSMNEFIGVLEKNPEIFFVSTQIEASFASDRSLCKLKGIDYTIKKTDYKNKKKLFDAASSKALKAVTPSMSDFEKALALHDYLILNVKYDIKKPTDDSRTAYDALVDGIAVCQGYSLAYIHLLKLCGIESIMLNSRAMNHAWNYVKIGNYWYHVDVTSDDPVMLGKTDMHGHASHNHFMLSDTALKKSEMKHRNWDTNGLPAAKNTAYDKLFLREIESGMVKLGSYWYFIMLDKASPSYDENFKKPDFDKNIPYYSTFADIYRYSFSKNTLDKIHQINSTWFIWGTEDSRTKSWWNGNYSSIAVYNERLYFNDSKSIYAFDSKGGKVIKILTPKNANGYIYGMTINDGQINYVIKQKPDATGSISKAKIK
ncbi:MAG: hypothetical protein LBR74_04020 [Eubacterium sp.]|nr:hypothetical protein [Eubacterium sp.]